MHTPTRQDDLTTWLHYLGNIHVSAIDMGLERVLPVFRALALAKPAFVFTVAGTNGKGSTTATIASICQQAGYKVALYQSPHLISFNERIKIDGIEVDDHTLIEAFWQVEQIRQACGVSLSFFEFMTLAAFYCFAQQHCAVWVLEIGLGGRLDVVNIIDPDVAVITNVAIDHTDWLGATREQIAKEKAGIIRGDIPVIYGEFDMPISISQQLQSLQAKYYCYGRDFAYQTTAQGWIYTAAAVTLALPMPSISVHNANIAVSAVLASDLAVDSVHICQGLKAVNLAGRFDVRTAGVATWVFDVAHNVAGVTFFLAQLLPLLQARGTQALHVVFSMLADKDIAAVLELFVDELNKAGFTIARWHIAPLDSPRTLAISEIAPQIHRVNVAPITDYATMTAAVMGVSATADDVVVCFGSFHTVGESLVALQQNKMLGDKLIC